MKGIARNKETTLSQRPNQKAFSKIPPGLVITRATPKINPRIPPKIAGQKVMYRVWTIDVPHPVSPVQPS